MSSQKYAISGLFYVVCLRILRKTKGADKSYFGASIVRLKENRMIVNSRFLLAEPFFAPVAADWMASLAGDKGAASCGK